jgi:hypothetical protein
MDGKLSRTAGVRFPSVSLPRFVRQAALVGRSRAGAARSAPPGRTVVPFPRRRRFRRHPPHPVRWRLWALLIALALVVAAIWKTQTSSLQSWFFGRWNTTLHFMMEPGPNPQTAFPVSGRFDERRGYTRIPEFRDGLENRGYRITEQARQSPALARLIRFGIAPPFREPPVTGLVIHDADGITLFDPTADHRVFRRFDLNTTPLAAVPGVGDVNGLGDGLRAWFAMDLADVCAALQRPEPTPEKARAYRHALALLYAMHAPTHYLVRDHHALESRVDAYADLLNSTGIIDAQLLAFIHHAPLAFAGPAPLDDSPPFVERKAVNAVRLELVNLLKVPGLYDPDRLNVQMDSTIDGALQDDVTQFLCRLASPEFVAANGLRERHILARGDPRQVTYSFLLLESRPEGNFVRVRADTDDAPFDVNEGMKLELGSTAKLRTLAQYLDVMAQLHDELSTLDTVALESRAAQARDALTRWAALTLGADPGLDPYGACQSRSTSPRLASKMRRRNAVLPSVAGCDSSCYVS